MGLLRVSEESFDNIIQPFQLPRAASEGSFCAISSTSGTATEVTAFSVITDYAKGIKYPLADFNITPDVAIRRPELTYTMPAKLCAHTGMDALTRMEASRFPPAPLCSPTPTPCTASARSSVAAQVLCWRP